MKSIINKLIKISLHLVMFSFVFLGISQATQAQNPLLLPALNVNGLEAYRGQYFTAIYASASAAGLASGNEHITVNTVYKQTQPVLLSENSITLAEESLAWTGTSKPNFIILVVHSTPKFRWVNGSIVASEISKISTKLVIELARSSPNRIADIIFGSAGSIDSN